MSYSSDLFNIANVYWITFYYYDFPIHMYKSARKKLCLLLGVPVFYSIHMGIDDLIQSMLVVFIIIFKRVTIDTSLK